MPQRSGLGAQLGIRKETAFGTYIAPNRFLPFTSETLALQKNFLRSAGLRAGRMAQASNLHKASTRTVEGNFVLELLNQGFGLIFDQLHGDAVTPSQIGATTAYEQTHQIGLTPPWDKSLTVQVGRPDTGGTVRAFSYLGCKVTQLVIAIESGGFATMTATLDGQDEDVAQALAVATYDSDAEPFTFNEIVCNFGGAEAANVRTITFTVSVPQNTARYNLGNAGIKDQPIANALVEVTAAATLEFASLADHNRFKNETVSEIAAVATGDVIGGGESFKAELTLPAGKQTTSGPAVPGPDVITQDVTFEGLDNGTDAPFEARLVSTDTAI